MDLRDLAIGTIFETDFLAEFMEDFRKMELTDTELYLLKETDYEKRDGESNGEGWEDREI